ncbi:hypothetical protein FGO68_gene6615 [Halteria grandinella]|uniref:Uncharacterized protein n=1 Tax=Halteria grandinella TaxID=5974 RepID=A0A8J8SU51_HALGN|nr:hypothetical protein FGO68_gene6615 [Halteria grandinella]
MGDYDPKMPYDEEAEQIEITKNLDNHILHDLIETPVKRQLPNRVERPREAFRKLVESNLSVALQSPQFKDFCKYLETDVAKDPKKCTCLICWQFVSDTQKKLHEAHGHHCLNPGKIRCEKSFLHYAKLFHHLTWDGIILLIKPAVNDTMAREKLQTMNLITHELKSRRENRGNYKGHPPFLSTPLCNINMKPIGISSAQILEKTHEEKITQQGFVKKPTLPAIEPQSRMPQMSFGSVSTQHLNPEEPPILNYGPLTDGYTAESRDKLCRIMAHLQEEMGSILRTHDEISHKLTLIATKQFQQEHPVGMYQVPDSQNMLEKVTLSQLESSSGIQLVQPPDDGKFYDPEKLMKHVQEGGYTSGQSYELFHCWKTARYNK